MATRAKDTSPGIVKEKRRISYSPSFPRPTNTPRKSVNTTTTTTIAPNYIKPSNVDPLVKPVNTKASSSTLPKPDLAQRRSFGSRQPKKAAPAANADTSTKSTGTVVVRSKPLAERSRSSSTPSAKPKVASTVRKPVPGKSSRPATIAVYKKKQPPQSTKTLKSTSTSANPELPNKSDSADEIDTRKSDHEVETESCQDIHDQESICSSSVVDADNENDNTSEMTSDMLHDDDDQAEAEQTNEEAYLLSEASTVVSEIEQSEAELENKVNEVTEKQNDESRRDEDDDGDASSKKDGLESEEEKVSNNETNENNSVDDKNEKAADKEKVVEQVSGGDEQGKSDNNDTKNKINKKESPAASNDVIEETASKLRVQRKNRVLALVGAFETVMSSQDS